MDKILDPICEHCENRELSCVTACAPLTWINGNIPTRELLITDVSYNPDTQYNYNDTLADMISDRNYRLSSLTDMKDIRNRAIAAMRAVQITQQQMADLLHMSRRQISRIIKKIHVTPQKV